jgi:hypothetical protein
MASLEDDLRVLRLLVSSKVFGKRRFEGALIRPLNVIPQLGLYHGEIGRAHV